MQKKMTWRYMFATFLFLKVLGVGTLKAQDELMPDFIPPAPTAASLIKFSEVPVGYHTGTPQVNVPIYEAKGKELGLNILLSYHAGGLKVGETPGWVGLGWALNAGGVISRSLQGLNDDYNPMGIELISLEDMATFWEENGGIGYFQVGKYLTGDFNCSAPDRMKINGAISKGNLDTQPDLFSFNFAGKTGKFVFSVTPDGTRTVNLMPKQDLLIKERIEHNRLVAFEVVDENGITYLFDEEEMTHAGMKIYTSSWYLKKIISANKTDSISFTYKDDDVSYGYQLGQVYSHRVGYGYGVGGGPLRPAQVIGSHLSISGKKIDMIETSKERIQFYSSVGRKDLNSRALKLDSLAVFSLNGNSRLKSFHLDYEYFISSPAGLPSHDIDAYRLRLESVTEVKSIGNSLPPHQFSYYYPNNLPRRNSYNQDWWGYYNGKGNDNWQSHGSGETQTYRSSGLFVPAEKFLYYDRNYSKYIYYDLDGADRTPTQDIKTASTGLLKDITYPTGGSVEFVYELHDYFFEGVLPPEIQNEIINLPHDNLSGVAPFVVKDFAKKFTFTFQNYYPTTGISLSGDDGFNVNFTHLSTGDGSRELFLEPGSYRFTVEHPGFDPEYMPSTDCVRGQYSEYSYLEPKSVAENQVGSGGVRIKRIINHHEDSELYGIRNFTYTKEDKPGESSGVLVGGFPRFSHIERRYGTNTESSYVNLVSDNFYHVRNSSVCSASYLTQGQPIGYSEVKVDFVGVDNGQNNGNIRYYYKVLEAPEIAQSFPYPPLSNNEYKQGKLVKEVHRNKYDEKVKKLEYEFGWSYGVDKVRGVKIGLDETSDVNDLIFETNKHTEWIEFNRKDYFLYSAYSPLIKTTETLYFERDSSKTVGEYKYKSPDLMAWKKDYNSLGECLKTSYTYPEDVIASGVNDEVVKSLYDRHMLAALIKEEQINVNKNKVVYGKETKYDFIQRDNSLGIIPRSISILEDQVYKEKLVFDTYNINGKILEYHQPGNISNCYVWGYEDNYPITKVTNALEIEVFHENFEGESISTQAVGGYTGNFSNSGSYFLNFILPNQKTYYYSYWYSVGGEWIYSGELEYLGPQNLNNGERIDDVRVYPKGSQMTTYTFDILLGQTSQTDPNGITTYYKYDDFGRLKYIKDNVGNILKNVNYHYKGQN